ncbi:GNAT family N-acetyltransferase [Solirubrobacter soli]|uniref:GNAT family N-acetyltransferase n=1 Tax=Solirubrobacter soli TaxID=363832 RepID=UPI00040BD581|nr:GNAT family N-acetyltransferase [Solirubrobacter soli]
MLTDGVITLRPPRADDAEALYRECQDPEIARWTGIPSPYERHHADAYLTRMVQEEAAGRTRAFLAVDAEDRVLASISVMELDKAPRYGEIGYWVAKDARGKGVASRAVTLLRDWCAGELGLERIELLIDEDNQASRRVAESTGFLETGELRPAPRQEESGALTHGVYVWTPE